MTVEQAMGAAQAAAPDPKALVLSAIRYLNLLHADQLSAADQALLREAIMLLWRVVEPANGGEAHARVW